VKFFATGYRRSGPLMASVLSRKSRCVNQKIERAPSCPIASDQPRQTSASILHIAGMTKVEPSYIRDRRDALASASS